MEVPALAEVLFVLSAIIFLFTLILILKSGILWEKRPEEMEEKDKRRRDRKSLKELFKWDNPNTSKNGTKDILNGKS